MNKEGITVAGNLIADVVYTIDVYPPKRQFNMDEKSGCPYRRY